MAESLRSRSRGAVLSMSLAVLDKEVMPEQKALLDHYQRVHEIFAEVFAEDDVAKEIVEVLVDRFPGQPAEFFSKVKSRVYDDHLRMYLNEVGWNDMKRILVSPSARVKPCIPRPEISLDSLLRHGRAIAENNSMGELAGLD